MVVEDGEAKSEAQRTRRNEEAVQSRADRSRRARTGQSSGQVGSESLSPNRDDWEGRNLINQRGQATVGGIVDRLIAKVVDEIAELELRTADREKYLLDLQEISEQLRQKPDVTE